jgi:hypothetical protein
MNPAATLAAAYREIVARLCRAPDPPADFAALVIQYTGKAAFWERQSGQPEP